MQIQPLESVHVLEGAVYIYEEKMLFYFESYIK